MAIEDVIQFGEKLSAMAERAARADALLREVELHFANGSADDGMDLWSRISDHLGDSVPCSGCGKPMIDRGAEKQWCSAECAKQDTPREVVPGVSWNHTGKCRPGCNCAASNQEAAKK